MKVTLKVGIGSSLSRYLLKLVHESSPRFQWRHTDACNRKASKISPLETVS